MRVTTQMLDESAKKTGLPVSRGKSLLDYVNNTSEGNTLLDALNASKSSSTWVSSSTTDISKLLNSLNKTTYEKLEEQADLLEQAADVFTADGEDSIFEKAAESGDRTDICQSAEKLIEYYNATIGTLQQTSDSLNQYYAQMLGEAVIENASALYDIGITMNEDGTLSLDQSKMEAAEDESLKKALGSSGTFTEKVAYIASRISNNAQAGIQSISSQYNTSGSICQTASGKYNFWA